MKKIIFFLIALMMILSSGFCKTENIYADETSSSVTFSIDKSSLKPGDEFDMHITFHSKYNDKNWNSVKVMIESDAFSQMCLKNWTTDISVKYTEIMGNGTKEYFINSNNRYSVDVILDEDYSTFNDINFDLIFMLDDDFSSESISFNPVVNNRIEIFSYKESDEAPSETLLNITSSCSKSNPLTAEVVCDSEKEDSSIENSSSINSYESIISSENVSIASSSSEKNNHNSSSPMIIAVICGSIVIILAGFVISYIIVKKKHKQV